ncbi:glycosyltransferase involved in cell wall biosynthesis [Massilia aurea]|uniref:Glycosyltransferase involved in cell wall biosynthesis n=1 Tax=Massilia aurea TaxID=373040 RepID=A0A7W9X3C2_9BURK|nr:glycosyltransferase [Massilia aurea]MBB6135757.1 glycosyltransferase involved in cell wall biosynthesis [Massilia aurea]
MRLIFDFHAPQAHPAHDTAMLRTLALALLRERGQATADAQIHVAVSSRHPADIDVLRQSFDGVLPADRLHVYAQPVGDDPWRRHSAGALRSNFLRALAPDLIVAMWQPDATASQLPADVPYVLGVADAAGVLAAGRAQQDLLRSAALVVAIDADAASRLDAVLAPAQVVSAADVSAVGHALARAVQNTPARLPAALPAGTKPSLALVSPLPPEHSGIADYSAELVLELERHYAVELVLTPGAVPDPALKRFAQRDVDYFMRHGAAYDRVLYHFGNSNVHKHMFALLRQHPGTVVLHDFFLSGVLDNMERDGDVPEAFLQALYASHGYTGLRDHREHGRNAAIWQYPCNKEVLDRAAGIIVHGDFSRRLAEQWYGPGAAHAWRSIPLLRGQVAGDTDPTAARAAARARLGLSAGDYVVSSFGMLGATKLNHRLLDAFLASPLAADPHCRLVYVGANDAGPYGIELLRKIADSSAGAHIRITGFVSAAEYQDWLAASDCAVQLRTRTRGETSASVLDCLMHGLPAIVNAHGGAADLPADSLRMLPDVFDDAALTAALASLHADASQRAALAQAGRAHIARHHAPAAVGALYVEAIEAFARDSAPMLRQQLVAALSAPGTPRAPNETALIETASMIAANDLPLAPRQLLIDVSALVQADHKTGIQRVVRSIVLALIKAPPAGYRIEPVYSDGGNRAYRYARRFTCTMLDTPPLALEDAPIEARAGDVFLGLDLATNMTTQNQPLLLALRRKGVAVWFTVYDLLPLLRPDCFPFGAEKYYGDFIDTISLVADGIVTISRAVADELAEWLAQRPNRRLSPLKLSHFHLGADIDASAPSSGLPDNAAHVLAALRQAPSLLMVGTLEPRKGQAQALAAFDLLWARGVKANLVIVGKNGWLVDALAERLETHPQREQHLFWFNGVSDEMLVQLYENSSALLAASEGEGFGLPLIEAAQKGLPIIARGIPVFREVAGEHAFYFDGGTPEDLAAAIDAWLALHAAGKAPQSGGMPWLTWEQSAQQLTDAVIGGRHHASVAAEHLAPQLLVDVSAMVREDLKTGIQRVVRAQLLELLRLQGRHVQVLPVYLSDAGGAWHYRHARRYLHDLMGTVGDGVHDDEVVAGPGDVFYSPDVFPRAVIEAARHGLYARWRQAGVRIHFMVHDILPVLRPDFFPPGAEREFADWLRTVGREADGLVCISAAVADETRTWLAADAPAQLPEFMVLHHGADINASQPSMGLAPDADAVLADIRSAPSFVMVGTIEPRKGHLQALDAFERLWAAGLDVRLVIVGAEGWKGLPDGARRTIPALVARLGRHPELGRRLYWLQGISDEYLDRVYAASTCLLFASEGEGFGLPLIEAARHGVPLLARDLPVFREVAGPYASYFDGTDGAALAGAVQDWLRLHAAGQAPAPDGITARTWANNATDLMAHLFPTP